MARPPLRLGVIADMHHNPVDGFPKICSSALPLLRRALDFSTRERVSGLVDLGDRIDDRERTADLALGKEISEVFHAYGIPREHLMGNHDSYSISVEEWESLLDRPLRSRASILGDYRLLYFCADVDNGRGARDYCLQDAELGWLERELPRDDRHTLIFTHVPLMAGNMAGNYYFENKPGRSAFLNAHRARRIIEESGNVLLVVSGHVHWNSLNFCNGVYYITVQSLTESFTTGGSPCGAHSLLQIDDDSIDLQVFGGDPIRFVVPRRKPAVAHARLRSAGGGREATC